MGRLASAWKALTGRVRDLPMPGAGFGRGAGSTTFGYQVARLAPGAKQDYTREIGERWANAAVAACLAWMARNIGQAKVRVVTPGKDKAPDQVHEDDPCGAVLAKPNPFMTGEELLGAMLLTDSCLGDTYLIKARGAGGYGDPVELWWVPPGMMDPYADPTSDQLIDSYAYRPGNGKTYYLPLDQVIHIKNGVDPLDPRHGRSPLRMAGDRSLVTLNRAETYQAAIVLNGGPIRLFIPEGPDVDNDEGLGIKSSLDRGSRAEKAGEIQVLSVPGRIEVAGSGPQEMALDQVTDRPEATICALMGLNTLVTNLPASNASRTFANLKEAEDQAWTNALVPTLGRFCRAFTAGLLPDFAGSEGHEVRPDYAAVKALSEDATEQVTRAVTAVGGPVATVNEGRAMMGLGPMPGEDESPTEKADKAAQAASDAAEAATANDNASSTDNAGKNADA